MRYDILWSLRLLAALTGLGAILGAAWAAARG